MPANKDIKIYLSDIEKSISEIFDFLPEKRNFLEFQKDLKTRKAVERNVEINYLPNLEKQVKELIEKNKKESFSNSI